MSSSQKSLNVAERLVWMCRMGMDGMAKRALCTYLGPLFKRAAGSGATD